MKSFFNLLFFSPLLMLLSCSGGVAKTKAKTTTSAESQQALSNASNRIKSDLNDIVNSISTQQPDTVKLKNAAKDILSTDANILSDSGINRLTGNDPSAKQAGGVIKKIRDATGLTPAALDSLKKTISALGQ